MQALRPWAKRELPTYEARRDYFQRVVEDALHVTVAIVGAGPGDPGLVTVRALELVRACEILVYDRLVSSDLVSRPSARRASRVSL